MRWARRCIVAIGLAACATPGQVRQVQVAVSAADANRARSDSAQRSELARIQIAQRMYMDSVNSLVRRLDEAIQRVGAANAAGIDNLREQLYQLANLSSTTRADLSKLTSKVNAAVQSAPATSTMDTANHGGGVGIPQPDQLLVDAQNQASRSANVVARQDLLTLLQSYPQAPQVPDALLLMGRTFDPTEPDSARAYYTKVWKNYPDAPAAPTALFKLGNLELGAKDVPAARRYWQMIVDKYKNALEYASALQYLRDNP